MKVDIATLAKYAALSISLVAIGLLIFAVYWACVYRLPRSQPISVDLRRARNSGALDDCCFMICAGLANNPHGYPGHCYIIWDRCRPENLENAQSDGFVPATAAEMLPSLYSDVTGVMGDRAMIGNMRSFDYVAVRLDRAAYERARAVREEFVQNTTFHTGVRDCVAYVNKIAAVSGLHTPPRSFVYPLDYLIRLKSVNRLLSRRPVNEVSKM